MALKLYNTLTRRKKQVKPIKNKEIKFYSCGPTVYNYAHIGNFRAYICSDILKRYLKYSGFKVNHVMNITDVDDKKIAYKSEDGSVYYDISKFKDYGKLSHTKIKGLKEGARVKQDSYEKTEAKDFALWKSYDKEDGNVFWETEIGKGRPGWHIECSAMSMKHLGEHFDIHAGGIDLVFPHHENEIAQSEAFSGKKFVNYWFHNEHLLLNGKKMSKSLGNFFTLRDLLNKG